MPRVRKTVKVTTSTVKKKSRKVRKVRSRKTRKSTTLSQDGIDYVNCALNPYSGIVAKVPDGKCHSVLLKFKQSVSVTPVGGVASVVATPGLPCSLIGVTGDFTGPSASGVTTSGVVGATTTSWMFPFKEMYTFRTGNSYLSNIMTVSKARCVSLHLEIVPSGPLLQQGGTAATAIVPTQFVWGRPNVFGPFNVGGSSSPGTGCNISIVTDSLGAPTQTSYSSIANWPGARLSAGTESTTCMYIPEDTDFYHTFPITRAQQATAPTPGTPYTVDSYPWQPSEITMYVGGDYTTGAYGAQTTLSLSAAQAGTNSDLFPLGNFWQPSASDLLVWSAQSLPTGQVYNVTVSACFELCVDADSTVSAFVTPPATIDEDAIMLVKDIIREAPPSVPAPNSAVGWWDMLVKLATGVAPIVASAGIPIVSPVAAALGGAFGALRL